MKKNIHKTIYNHSENIGDKLGFSYEIAHCGKGSISILQEIFASVDKALILGYGQALGFRFYELKDFPDTS